MKNFVTKTKSIVHISILLMLMAPGYLLANKCPTSISITTGSSGQTLCQNATPSDVIATGVFGGAPPTATNITYQWYYNTTNSTTVSGATIAQTATNTTTATTTNTLSGTNITTSTAGTYYYFCVLTDATCGVTVITGTVKIIITAGPSDNSGVNKTTCSGTGVSIGASSTFGHTYSWSPSANLSSSVSANPTATPTITTTYSLTETITSTGCAATNTSVVTVNPLPSDNSGANQNACSGVSTSIGASSTSGHTYKWSPSTGLNSSTAANPTIANPTTTTTYSLTETITATGCSATNTTVVTVNALPANKTVSAVTTTLCSGSSTNIQVTTSTSGVNYQLRNNADNSLVGSVVAGTGGTINLPTGALGSTTTFNVLATIATTGCSLQMTTTPSVTVNALPSDNSGANQALCKGASVSIGASSTVGHTYKWSPSTALTSTAVANPTANPTITTTYSLTETITATGCSATNSTIVTVNQNPSVSLSASPTTVCNGSSTTLTATNSGGTVSGPVSGSNNTVVDGNGTDPQSVSTSITLPSGTLTSLSNITLTIDATHTWAGDLTATLTSPCGTTTIFSRPGGSSNGDNLVTGDYVFTSASGNTFPGSSGGNVPTGTYNATFSGVSLYPTCTTIGGTWTLTISTATGGNNRVIELDSWSISIANANVYTTAYSGTGTIGSVSYSGTNNSTAAASASPISSPTVYTAVTTDGAGCTASTTTTVTLGTAPTALALTGTASICGGNSSNISIASSQSGVIYQLRNNADNSSVGSAISGTGGTIILPTGALSSTTTFNVLATNTASTCTTQMTGTITITVSAAPGDNAGSDKSYCTGGSVVIGASSTTGHTYKWSPSTGLSSTAISNPTANPTVTTTYTLTETITSTGCSAANMVVVNVNAFPAASISPSYCNGGGNVVLSVPSSGSYVWSNAVTNQSITVDRAGSYAVTVTSAAGCTASSSYTVALELVTNGDFESGNTGFTTTYTYTNSSNGLYPEGYYAVGSNANYYHGNFFGTDHTTGSGNFMIVNGATSATPVVVWQETVTLIPNTNYYFSAFAMSMNGDAPWAQLKFAVNGAQVGTTANLTTGATTTAGPFTWTRFYATWNSGSSTTVTLSIVDLQTAAGGNDFGLDDISCSTLSTVPLSATPATNTPICAGNTLQVNSNILGGMMPMTYKWTGPNSFNSTSINDSILNATTLAAGIYSLTVTDSHGCSVTGSTSSAVINPIPSDNAGADVSTCSGTGIAIGAASTTGHTYSWSPSTNLSNSTAANPTATPTLTTTYTLTETISSTGCSASNSAVVNVNALPVNNAGSAKTICNGGSAVIGATSTAGHTYSWSPTAGLSSATVSNPTAAPTVTTTYTLTESITATGCSASNSVVVTVNSIPVNNAGSAKSVCLGSGVAIGASSVAGHTYSWSPSTSLSSSTAANPTATPTITTSYNLTETITATTCAATNSVTVTVNPLPSNNAGSNQSVCGGVGVPIGAASTAGHTYSWSPSATLSSSTTANPTATPTVTTTYTLAETITATGCSATNTAVVTTNPGVSNNAGSAKTICNGGSVVIGAASTAGHTYSWSPSTNLTSSTVANPTANPTATTSYTLTETITATGCTAANSVVVTVNPTPGNNAGSNQSICGGVGVGIGATSTAGHTYSWSPSTGLSNATAANPTANPTITSTYTLTETITATGCTAANSVSVTLNAAVANNAGSAKSICNGGSTTIGASGTAGHTYSWSPSSTLTSSTVANPTANPTATTTYTLSETITATGCAAANSVVVTVNSAPGNNAGSNQSICYGNGIAIGATSTAGHTYSWSPSSGLTSATAANPTANPIITSTYTLTETITASGCSASNSVTVTVNSLPVNNAGSAQSACGGISVTIGAASTAGHTYSWSPTTNLTSATIANPTAAPTVTTTYTLTEVITATGCSSSNSVMVTVNPGVSNNAGSAKSTCSGTGVAIGAGSTAGHTYNWSTSATLSNSTISNPTASPTATTTYTLTETITATGCSAANTAVVTVNPIPVDNAGADQSICSGSGIAIGAASTAGHTYSWSPSTHLSSATAANPTATPTVTTTYSLTETITATTCAVTNSAVVTVISAIPNNAGSAQSVCKGSGVTLGAASTSGHTYSWSPSATLSSAIVSNPTASPTVTTTYTLTETITAGGCSASNSVVVTVNNPPTISAQPSNQTTCGSTTTFSVTASGSPTYQWYENRSTGTFSAVANGSNSFGQYSNATTNALQISSPTSAMNGWSYYCVVTTNSCSTTSSTVTLTVTAGGMWLGVTSTNWDDASNWCGGVPNQTTDVTIPSGVPHMPNINVNDAQCHSLTINSSATVTVSSGGILSLYGDLTVNGTFTQSAGTLDIKGSTTQNIAGVTAYNVIIDNGNNGVTLAGNMTITNNLTFNNGMINTGSYEVDVTNTSTSSIVNFDQSKYVNGFLRRNVSLNGAYNFPVGSSAQCELAIVNFTAQLGISNIVANFNVSSMGTVPSGLTSGGKQISQFLNYGYWTITPNQQPIAGVYSITLNPTGHSNGGGASSYVVVKKPHGSASTSWSAPGTSLLNVVPTILGAVGASMSGLTSFSDFGAGVQSGTVLPIKLLYFTAEKCDDDVDAQLKWSTATEENNDHFELEEGGQSSDNSGQINFHTLGEVKGAGNSVVELDYSFVDTEANKSGTRYYRLKQVDFDSTATYSDIVALDFSGAKPISMSALYPNPVSDMLHFKLTSPDERTITVSVSNLIGQEIFREPMQLNAGENSMNLDVTQLNKGLFFLSLIDGTTKYVPQKFEKF